MRSVKDFQETQKLIDEYKSYNDKIPELLIEEIDNVLFKYKLAIN